MTDFAFYAAFIGTAMSIFSLTSLAWKEHHPNNPRSLSSIVSQRRELVMQFRIISAVVSTLFTISVFFFIVPRVKYGSILFVVWLVCYIAELLVSIFPERGTIEKQLHSLFAYIMALCMILTTLILALSFDDWGRLLEIGLLLCGLSFAALAQIDKKRFIFYELPFIYTSHLSVLVALLALK